MDVWRRTCLTPVGGFFTDEHSCALPCSGFCSWQCCSDSSGYDCPHSFSPEAQHLGSLETRIQSAFLRYLGHSSLPWKGFKPKYNVNFYSIQDQGLATSFPKVHLFGKTQSVSPGMLCSAVKPGCFLILSVSAADRASRIWSHCQVFMDRGFSRKAVLFGRILLDKMVTRNSPHRKRTCKGCHTWCMHLPTGKTYSVTWMT